MLSVSELNEQAKTLLETTFSYVEVEGEISRLVRHGSGHWYFTLKDEKAAISAVIYKFNAAKLKFDVTDGMKVALYGKISLYSPSGSYQFIATLIRPSGEGELELAFKQLKARLESEGLFDISRKKPLPKFPRKIALITSKTSAALQDMLRIAHGRWALAEVIVFDSLTQGETAPSSLIRALKRADASGADAIVLARGGGSREDLWCFNDENLAREIYAVRTPVISAVGHEIDYVISDFAADFRAPTPSAAQSIDRLSEAADAAFARVWERKFNALAMMRARFSQASLTQKIARKEQILLNLRQALDAAAQTKLLKFENALKLARAAYAQQESFFAQISNFVRVQKEGKTVNLSELKPGDRIALSSINASKEAEIL